MELNGASFILVSRLQDLLQHLAIIDFPELLTVEAIWNVLAVVLERLVNDIRVAFVAPIGEVSE